MYWRFYLKRFAFITCVFDNTLILDFTSFNTDVFTRSREKWNAREPPAAYVIYAEGVDVFFPVVSIFSL